MSAPPPYPVDKGQPQPGGPPMQGYPPQGPYGAPPAGGYQPQYPQPGQPAGQPYGQQTTVVITAPAYSQFGEFPCQTTCQHCRAAITTSTMYETGTMTWLIAGILLLVGCWLGCCLIPFCVNGCKDVIHSCPNCHQIVGRFKRM